MGNNTALVTAIALIGSVTAMADFQYEDKTQITGGAMTAMMKLAGAFSKQAREANAPTITNTYVKGNRMARISAHRGELIDLDKETITNIDFDKKQYTIMTFEQMKKAAEQAMEDAKAERAKQPQPAAAPPDTADKAEVKFRVSVKDTGAKKQVSGLDTHEYVMNLFMDAKDKQTGQSGTFTMSNDMWNAAEIPGYQEVRDFERKLALKYAEALGSSVDLTQFGRMDMAKGMTEMAKEASKLKGMPILQITRMGTTPDGSPLPSASEAPDAAKVDGPNVNLKEETGKAAGNAAGNTAGSMIESRLGKIGGIAGGLGGLARRKKQQDEQAQQKQAEQNAPPQQQQQQGPAILMEMTAEKGGFSSAPIDAAKFAPPAGFRQVEPEEMRPKRKR